MGYDVIGKYPAADRLLDQAANFLHYDLADVCLEGSGRKHVPPRHEAQVIYVVECLYAAVLTDWGHEPRAVSGHSLGSLAAGYACGGLDFTTGLELVTCVEDLLEELVDGRGLATGVVIGLPEVEVTALLEAAPGVHLANWNSPGQYVIGGDQAGVDRVLAGATARGAKQSRHLAGERAMHTPHLAEVAARFAEHLGSVSFRQPRVPLIDCHDGRALQTADALRSFLGSFLALPVRWETTVLAIRQEGEGEFVEVGPGNVLSKMLPFIDRTAAIRTASDLLDPG